MIVNGRPEIAESIGGHFSQRQLVLENLSDWKKLKNWKTATETFIIRLGQDDGFASRVAKGITGHNADTVPKTATCSNCRLLFAQRFL